MANLQTSEPSTSKHEVDSNSAAISRTVQTVAGPGCRWPLCRRTRGCRDFKDPSPRTAISTNLSRDAEGAILAEKLTEGIFCGRKLCTSLEEMGAMIREATLLTLT